MVARQIFWVRLGSSLALGLFTQGLCKKRTTEAKRQDCTVPLRSSARAWGNVNEGNT